MLNIILAGLFVISISIISLGTETFSNITLTSPNGINEKISLPYISNKIGDLNVYRYDITFNNTFLFSGMVQIVPDDCIERIIINGKEVPGQVYKNSACEGKNGFYLNIKQYLQPNINHIRLEVKNTQGFYGLYFSDVTSYSKYFAIAIIFFGVTALALSQGNWHFLRSIPITIKKFKKLIGVTTFTIVIFLTTLLCYYVYGFTLIWQWIVMISFILCAFVPTSTIIYHYFLEGKIIAVLFLISVALNFLHLIKIPYNMFAYDIDGHLEYIQYLSEFGEVPIPSGGWMFYHPSLYYRIASFYSNTLHLLGDVGSYRFGKSLQCFTLFLFVFYNFISLKTIDLLIRSVNLTGITKRITTDIHCAIAACFLLWPANGIFSIRIGNDILLNLLYACSFYFSLKYYLLGKERTFLIALALGCASTWAKTNGFIVLGVLGLVLLIKLFFFRKTNPILYIRKAIIYFCIVGITFYLSFHQKIEQLQANPSTRLVVGNANGLGQAYLVSNKPLNFLTLNLEKFVKVPFTNTVDDNKGRQSFWFFLFKSSMFGEFGHSQIILIVLAKALSFFFLLNLLIFLAGIPAMSDNLYLPFSIALVFFVGSMIVFRMFYPFSSSNDFRYVFPALLPIVVIWGFGLSSISKWKFLYLCCQLAVASFLFLSIMFQILMPVQL